MPEPGVVDGVVVVLLLPELPPELVDGLVVLLPLEPEPVVLLPEAPEPALEPLRASVMHLSRSAPVSPTHLLASEPDAPAAPELAPVDELPEELPPTDGVDEDELPAEDGLDGLVVLLPDEPAPALPEALEPLLPDAPVLPPLEPEDWLNAAPDSARSAAAVAAVRVFNIMRGISFEGWMNIAAGLYTQAACLVEPRNFFARWECLRSGAPLSARRAYHDRNRTCEVSCLLLATS